MKSSTVDAAAMRRQLYISAMGALRRFWFAHLARKDSGEICKVKSKFSHKSHNAKLLEGMEQLR